MEKNMVDGSGEGSDHAYDDARRASLQVPLDQAQKTWLDRAWPTFACGAGLYSDGYVQSVIGSVNTILGTIYGTRYSASSARKNVGAIAFAGTVAGQLFFGVLSDYWSRRNSLLISTVIIIIFSILSAGAYGGGSLDGMTRALTAYRFLVGIGLGGEYPAGSVAAAESSGELKAGTRNRWFIFATDFQLDLGFVGGTLVPMIAVLACGDNHLRAAWRISLGIGAVFPFSLLFLRMKLKEPAEYSRQKMTKFPYWLILKKYWFRLLCISLIWFIYDLLTYSFSLYSSVFTSTIIGDSAPLWVSLGWATLINAFYIPGSFIGAFTSDWFGPKWCLIGGVVVQGAIGFLMTGIYNHLAKPSNIAGFVVVYGIFLSCGEIGPGDNIGLIANKLFPTAVRGQAYAIAAAIGKIGAFSSGYIFPDIIALGGSNSAQGGRYAFYVSSALCFVSAIIALALPNITQDYIVEEDERFRQYLAENGYDTNSLGTKEFKQEVAEEAHGF